jgi:class 3 adenylate cyclase/tetratricopeptide (TPR) repeat protein
MTCSACGAQLPEDARFCPACGAAVEAAATPAAEERKLATVLFADLVGSTATADRQDPERVRATLDRFYDAMTEEIVRTGGTVEHFAGDSVMAAFGAPAALEDHAERALHAALAMQRRLTETFGDELALRIGVNTGDVVVGRPREGSSFVTGDAVNVGARLEQAATPGEVLAGERTVAAVRGAFEFGESRVVEAKGKAEGVFCRPVLRALTLMRPRGVGGFGRVFVGRESELELLRATYRRAVAQGEPHLVTIVGEPGVGKTRLVRELWDALEDEAPAPLRRTGRCLAYGEGITYWALGEIVKEHFGIVDTDPPGTVRGRLAGHEILGLVLGLDVSEGLHPRDVRERLHAAVVRLVEELAVERALVMLVEDLHWAEDDLLDALERVLRDARAPVVLLTTARPEFLSRRAGWGAARRNTATIWLEPLQPQDTQEMLDGLLSLELPAALEQLVVERAGGNPFFVEELVGELVEAGVLERHNGGWRTGELPEGFSVPDSVHAVLAARIDRLPSTEKAALQAASVVGGVFWPSAVVHVLEGADPSFDELEDRDFVRVRSGSSIPGEREYAFKHALTREVAYSSIPKARRGRLHAALANWMTATDRATDEYASLLAYHYAEAVRPEDADLVWEGDPSELARLRQEAVSWSRRAGELARRRGETEEAIALLRHAVELCDDPHECALVWRDVGLAHALQFDGDAFWSAMDHALQGPLEPAERAEVYGQLAFQTSLRAGIWGIRTVPDHVREWAERALELAPDDSKARVRALLARANIDPVAHADIADVVTPLAERTGDVELRSYALMVRASIAFEAGRFEEAGELADQKLELIPEIDDPDHLMDVYESVVPVIVTLGRLDEARRLAEHDAAIATTLSPHHRVHSAALRCELEDAAGAWETIAEQTDAIVDVIEANLETPCARNARSLLLAAVANAAVGDDDRTRALERRAEALSYQGWSATAFTSPSIRLSLLRGDRSRLASLLEPDAFRMWVYGPGVMTARLDALTALRDRERIEAEAPPFAKQGLLLEPFALRALGAVRGDDELLGRAQERFAALGLDWHAAQTERLLAGF